MGDTRTHCDPINFGSICEGVVSVQRFFAQGKSNADGSFVGAVNGETSEHTVDMIHHRDHLVSGEEFVWFCILAMLMYPSIRGNPCHRVRVVLMSAITVPLPVPECGFTRIPVRVTRTRGMPYS
jgi:hypothetical protein